MYHPTEIAQLSNAQISKLLKGHGVRVKSGKGHVVNLSSEQLKKHQTNSHKFDKHRNLHQSRFATYRFSTTFCKQDKEQLKT